MSYPFKQAEQFSVILDKRRELLIKILEYKEKTRVPKVPPVHALPAKQYNRWDNK